MRYTKAFTLVELLIVIVIIAILAVISIVAYNGMTLRSQATEIIAQSSQVEKSLRMWATTEEYTAWPDDTGLPGGSSRLFDLIPNTTLKEYLPTSPETVNPAHAWEYDNDMDVRSSPCSSTNGTVSRGTNVNVAQIESNLATLIDQLSDGGDGVLCGKFRYNATSKQGYFNLSDTNAF